jgi:WD40 repeat protein
VAAFLRIAVVLAAIGMLGCTRTAPQESEPPGARTLTRSDGPARLAVAPDGKSLAVSSGNTIRLFDTATGEVLRTLTGHTRPVHAVKFSPDGRLIASAAGAFRDGTRAGEVKVWDAATGGPKHTLAWWPDGDVNAVAFSPGGEWVVGGGLKGVRVWSARTGKTERELPVPAAILAVAFSPDGTTLAAGAFDECVHLWDVATWEERRVLRRHRSEVRAVAFSPDGTTLATGGVGELRLWNARTADFRRTIAHESTVWSVAFSPDGKTLATASGDPRTDSVGEVRLWDAADGAPKDRWSRLGGAAKAVAFSPDGKTLAVGWYDGAVELRDLAR